MKLIKSFFTKADLILMAAIVILGLGISIFLAAGSHQGNKVEITKDGKLWGTYSLDGEHKITIRDGKERNVVKISGGKVTMESANCKNQVCVHHSPVSRTGESIVCLPHKIVVSIKGEDNEYDTISN
ncbi:NusG domain II-containing protein [Clostridiales Family XIII bacterium RF-744-FAT-WT-3]|uniref:NusG domain II-containing protein n=1 Tax=Baileyella intestinalis TaxID=2606709 RepID=A0A6A8M9R9_9FIRM|nr:NusG domain II-containing protein [Baileyella intestinalis]MST68574.1 NusG domain II-containing protein [Baileyella intestinalis]